jgi:hypothetical protein
MCEPVTLAAATFGLGAASAGLTYVGQAQTAAAQEQVEQRRFEETERFRRENAENAVSAFGDNVAQLSNRRMEEDAQRTSELERVRRETRVASGAALASATAGAGGLQPILTQLARQGGAAVNQIEANARFRGAQYSADVSGARAQALEAINSARPYIPTPVIQPSALGLAVDVGKAGLQGGTTYYQVKYLQQNPHKVY